jgi:hypothetical protein
VVHDRDAEREGLARSRELGVRDVHVVHVHVGAVLGRDERLAEDVDMLAMVREARGIVKVHELGGPVGLRLVLEDVHGLARSREQHGAVVHLEVERRIRRVERVTAGRGRDQVLDQRAREAQAAVLAEDAAPRDRVLQDLRDRLADADLLQELECGVVDALDVPHAQGAVLATLESRMDG